jgi:uncharacterized protein (TIGR03382 family)
VTGTVVGPDQDGDGVDDGSDPFPDDPNRCGDSDADGCDDCSTGHFDLANDCEGPGPGPGGGTPSGCCDANTGSPVGWFALGGLVLGLLYRRRRR